MRKKRFFIFLFINAVVFCSSLALALVYLYSRKNGLSLLDCIFYETFGFPCMGCGSTRAILSLFRLDIPKALYYSPGLCFSLFTLLYYDTVCLISFLRRDDAFFSHFKVKILLFIPLVFFLVFLVRAIAHFAFGVNFI